MKIKQFFIDNKLKIKKVLNIFLSVLFFLVYSYTIFACGYNSKLILEESNKKELVNRKEVYNSDDYFGEFNYQIGSFILGPYVEVIFYSSDSYLEYKLYSDVYLNDDYIYFDYFVDIIFGNRSFISVPGNLYVSFDDLDIDSDVLFSDESLFCTLALSNLTLPYAPEGSEALYWNIDLEFEFGFLTGSYDSYYYFTPSVVLDIRELVLDDYWFDNYDGWIQYLLSIADEDFTEVILDSKFYTGSNPYYYFKTIFGEGFDIGYELGFSKNIFYYDLANDSPVLLVYDDVSFIRPDDYDEDLLFKNNYLDLQYLRNLYGDDYSKFRIIFNSSIYSLNNLYLYLDNSSLVDYNILVNGKSYVINSSSTLNINSSELLQAIEFDSNLLDSTRLVNSSPEFASGFNQGYDNGYQNGYSDGEIYQEDYYEELIIPAVKLEYEEIGYDKGYLQGKNDTLNEGSGVALFDAFTLIGKGFEAWNPILNIQVLPGLTLGVFIAIPIVIAVVIVVIKLLQR